MAASKSSNPAQPGPLRCRVGDTVIIIATNHNHGKIGVITRRISDEERLSCGGDPDHIWLVRSLGGLYRVTNGKRHWKAPEVCSRDRELMPLRDQPGKDEMLRLAGKPKRVRRASATAQRSNEA